MELELNNNNLYTIIAKKCEEKEIHVDFYTSLTEYASYAYFNNLSRGFMFLCFDRYDTPAAVVNNFINDLNEILKQPNHPKDVIKFVKNIKNIIESVQQEYELFIEEEDDDDSSSTTW